MTQEFLTVLLGFQVNSADVSSSIVHRENVHLEHIFVHFLEVFNQSFLELLLSLVLRFAQTLSDQGQERVVLLIMEEEFDLSDWLVLDSNSDLLVDAVSSFRAIEFEKSTCQQLLGFFFSFFVLCLFLLDDH